MALPPRDRFNNPFASNAVHCIVNKSFILSRCGRQCGSFPNLTVNKAPSFPHPEALQVRVRVRVGPFHPQGLIYQQGADQHNGSQSPLCMLLLSVNAREAFSHHSYSFPCSTVLYTDSTICRPSRKELHSAFQYALSLVN